MHVMIIGILKVLHVKHVILRIQESHMTFKFLNLHVLNLAKPSKNTLKKTSLQSVDGSGNFKITKFFV